MERIDTRGLNGECNVISDKVVRRNAAETITFKQRLEGSEHVIHDYSRRNKFPAGKKQLNSFLAISRRAKKNSEMEYIQGK